MANELATRAAERDNTAAQLTPHGVEAYRADIQGLRAVAVIAVVLYHASGLLAGGFVGVDVFFVISGFVITRSLTREYDRTGGISLRGFYRRRVHRLTPALLFLLLVVIPLSVLLAPIAAVRSTAGTGVAAAFLSANVFLASGPGYFDLGAESNPLAHTWSLSLEEQFYLFFPALLVALVALGATRIRRRTLVVAGLSAIGLLSLAGCLLAANTDGAVGGVAWSRVAFFAMPLRAWQFIGGALVALVAVPSWTRRFHTVAASIGVLLLLVAFWTIEEARYPGVLALVPTVGTMLLIATPLSVIAPLLSWSPLRRAGDVSYSWYLLHWPAIVFFRVNGVESALLLAAIGFATYPLAEWSYRNVEQRFLYRPGMQRHRWVVMISASAVGALIVGVASVAIVSRIESSNAEVGAAIAASDGSFHNLCTETQVSPTVPGCVIGSGARRIALVGDSNAEQFAGSLARAAAQFDASLTVVTENGCPLVDVTVVKFEEVDPNCEARVEAVLPWLTAETFDVVVLANAFDAYLQTPNERVTGPPGAPFEDGAPSYAAALEDLVTQLEGRGSDVVVVHPIPKPAPTNRVRADFRTTVGCSFLGIVTRDSDVPFSCSDQFDQATARANQQVAVDVEIGATSSTGAILIDPFDTLCAPRCSAHDGVQWVYEDYGHVSSAYAEEHLTPMFAAALRRTFEPSSQSDG